MLSRRPFLDCATHPGGLFAAVVHQLLPVVRHLDVRPRAPQCALDLLERLRRRESYAPLEVQPVVLTSLQLVLVEEDAVDAQAETRRRGHLSGVRLTGIDCPCPDSASHHSHCRSTSTSRQSKQFKIMKLLASLLHTEGVIPSLTNVLQESEAIIRSFICCTEYYS